MQVEFDIGEDVPQEEASAARGRIAALDRYGDRQPLHGRLALRRSESPDGHAYLAYASVVVDGRRLVAYASGDTVLEAAAEAADRLDRKIPRTRDRVLVPGQWFGWAREARRDWRLEGDTLVRELRFRDFEDAMRLLEQVAWRAEDYKRHPELSIAGNRVRLRIVNPHRSGITLAELRLAAKVNAVIDEAMSSEPVRA
jgi:4a-hydroxytetrahydrobiopterin dehydratase